MYGDPSFGGANGYTGIPIDFEFTLRLDNLRLLPNEYKTLVDQFIDISKKKGLTITVPNTVRDAIFNAPWGIPALLDES